MGSRTTRFRSVKSPPPPILQGEAAEATAAALLPPSILAVPACGGGGAGRGGGDAMDSRPFIRVLCSAYCRFAMQLGGPEGGREDGLGSQFPIGAATQTFSDSVGA